VSDSYRQGTYTRQAHKGIPEGLYEEEQGLKGFFGPVSHLLKRKPSTGWVEIEGTLRPHMFDLVKLTSEVGFQRLLYNQNLTIGLQTVEAKAAGKLRARRNADGDLLLFCHAGSGEILSEYGLLNYKAGHYLIIPKCLTYAVAAVEKSVFFIVENRCGHYEQPDRGIVGRHAIYDPDALGRPDLERQRERQKYWGPVTEIEVKREGEITRFRYPECVFSGVVGWKGDLYPFSLHVDHMMPLMSHRAHLPPSAHTTFVAREFVICTFLPRPLEKDADALKVPFYHQNIDYDEVLFYHAGDFFSRDNLHAGMMSLHPAGFPHGPHPKAVRNVNTKTETNEYAVMVDSRWPLKIDAPAEKVELQEYWRSWQE
jgi:homogentisate 1,2-dioxygenase